MKQILVAIFLLGSCLTTIGKTVEPTSVASDVPYTEKGNITFANWKSLKGETLLVRPHTSKTFGVCFYTDLPCKTAEEKKFSFGGNSQTYGKTATDSVQGLVLRVIDIVEHPTTHKTYLTVESATTGHRFFIPASNDNVFFLNRCFFVESHLKAKFSDLKIGDMYVLSGIYRKKDEEPIIYVIKGFSYNLESGDVLVTLEADNMEDAFVNTETFKHKYTPLALYLESKKNEDEKKAREEAIWAQIMEIEEYLHPSYETRKKNLLEAYGEKLGMRLLNEGVRIGDDYKMMKLSKGACDDHVSSETATSYIDIYYYPGEVITMVNGKITRITNY